MVESVGASGLFTAGGEDLEGGGIGIPDQVNPIDILRGAQMDHGIAVIFQKGVPVSVLDQLHPAAEVVG